MKIAQILIGNVLYPLVEGQSISIDTGDTLRVFYSFDYKIPETSGVKIWASLYRYTLGILDRSSKAQTKEAITLVKSYEWKPYSGEIDIVVGSVDSGLWGLILELPDYDEEVIIDNCINITAIPKYELIQDYNYPLASTYNGYVEECTFTFSLGPEQIPGTDWFRDLIINNFGNEVVKEGANMIGLQVWEDTTPTWHTDYKVIATATASPVPWLLIIGIIMLILFLIPIAFTIIELRKFWLGVVEPVLTDIMPIIGPLLVVGLMMFMFSIMTPALKREEQ